jgi:hypothetical protein
MKSYIREKHNFSPIPFSLVSNQDHISPAAGMILCYLISINGSTFQGGIGQIRDVGDGSYELTLAPDEQQSGPRLILIPASGTSSGHDPVYFRVNDVPAIEVSPISQGYEYLLPFVVISNQDHFLPLPRATPTVTISRDGRSFQTFFGLILEIGHGFYGAYVSADAEPVAPEWNNECVYTLKVTAPGADVTYDSFQVFRYHQPA